MLPVDSSVASATKTFASSSMLCSSTSGKLELASGGSDFSSIVSNFLVLNSSIFSLVGFEFFPLGLISSSSTPCQKIKQLLRRNQMNFH